MSKCLLESTFVLETQIFQAKKTFWMPLYSFISRADSKQTDKDNQSSGAAVINEKNRCFWHS